jgi:hypothetical protein
MTVNTAIKSSDKKAKDVAYFSKIIRQHLPWGKMAGIWDVIKDLE